MEPTEPILPLDVIKHHLQLYLASNKWTAACRLVSRSWRDGIKLYNICITPQRSQSKMIPNMLSCARGVICESLLARQIIEIVKLLGEYPQISELVIKKPSEGATKADYHIIMQHILQAVSIKTLRIINRALTADFVSCLKHRLPRAVHLERMDISFNDIAQVEIKNLLSILPPNVKAINLRGLNLRHGLEFSKTNCIEELDVSETNIATIQTLLDAGISHLILASNALNGLNFLVHGPRSRLQNILILDISYCMLGDAEAYLLSSVLSKDPPRLEELNISGNPFYADGMKMIVKGLKANTTLRRLIAIDTSEPFAAEDLAMLQKERPHLRMTIERETL